MNFTCSLTVDVAKLRRIELPQAPLKQTQQQCLHARCHSHNVRRGGQFQ